MGHSARPRVPQGFIRVCGRNSQIFYELRGCSKGQGGVRVGLFGYNGVECGIGCAKNLTVGGCVLFVATVLVLLANYSGPTRCTRPVVPSVIRRGCVRALAPVRTMGTLSHACGSRDCAGPVSPCGCYTSPATIRSGNELCVCNAGSRRRCSIMNSRNRGRCNFVEDLIIVSARSVIG